MGATPAAKRAKRVNAFQNGEGDLFLISLEERIVFLHGEKRALAEGEATALPSVEDLVGLMRG